MDEKNADFPDLLWSCFINWLNTLEDEGFFKNPIKTLLIIILTIYIFTIHSL